MARKIRARPVPNGNIGRWTARCRIAISRVLTSAITHHASYTCGNAVGRTLPGPLARLDSFENELFSQGVSLRLKINQWLKNNCVL